MSSARDDVPPVPATLRAVVVIVGAEAVLLTAWAVWSVVNAVRGTTNPGVGAFLAVFAGAIAALLVVALRALLRRRRLGRAPVVGWQLLQGGVAVALLQGGAPLGWVLLVPALLVIGLMVSRPVVEHTVPS